MEWLVAPLFLQPVMVGPVNGPGLLYTVLAQARARRRPIGFLLRSWIGPMYLRATVAVHTHCELHTMHAITENVITHTGAQPSGM